MADHQLRLVLVPHDARNRLVPFGAFGHRVVVGRELAGEAVRRVMLAKVVVVVLEPKLAVAAVHDRVGRHFAHAHRVFRTVAAALFLDDAAHRVRERVQRVGTAGVFQHRQQRLGVLVAPAQDLGDETVDTVVHHRTRVRPPEALVVGPKQLVQEQQVIALVEEQA
ncbi:hypothetical protein D3C72_685750 [compost metagenome]